MTNDDIATRLKAFIDDKGWTQAEFGRIAGIARQNVPRYLKGKSHPGKIVIKLIPYGLNPEWLLTGKGDMYVRSKPVQTPVEQPIKLYVNEEMERYTQFPPEGMTKAIGKKMCKEGIQEGDLILLDQEKQAQPGDLVLQIRNEAPSIERYKPGDPQPYAICIRLIRNLRAKPRTDCSN